MKCQESRDGAIYPDVTEHKNSFKVVPRQIYVSIQSALKTLYRNDPNEHQICLVLWVQLTDLREQIGLIAGTGVGAY